MNQETRRVRVPLLAPSKPNEINGVSKRGCLSFAYIRAFLPSKRQLCDNIARSLIAGALCGAMAACGGGGSNGAPTDVQAKQVYPIPLRPCETTSSNAPPCPASQAAGAH
jgi:hypothetical protein